MKRIRLVRAALLAAAGAAAVVALPMPSFALHRSAPATSPAASAADVGNVSATLDPVVYGPVDLGLPAILTRRTTYKVTFLVLLTAGQHSELLHVDLTGGELRRCEKKRLQPGVVNKVVCEFLAGRARSPQEKSLTFSLRVGVKGRPYLTTYRHPLSS